MPPGRQPPKYVENTPLGVTELPAYNGFSTSHNIYIDVENAMLYENLRRSNRKMEAAMESQRKAQDQMLASARMAVFGELSLNIAHELNNPLTGILGYTDLILGASVDDVQTEEML